MSRESKSAFAIGVNLEKNYFFIEQKSREKSAMSMKLDGIN